MSLLGLFDHELTIEKRNVEKITRAVHQLLKKDREKDCNPVQLRFNRELIKIFSENHMQCITPSEDS